MSNQSNQLSSYMCGAEIRSPRRLARVFVIDNDRDLPVEHATLYDSKECMTDDVDSELFFQIGIPRLLLEHNEKRRELGLKDIKIRDLTFNVSTLVQF